MQYHYHPDQCKLLVEYVPIKYPRNRGELISKTSKNVMGLVIFTLKDAYISFAFYAHYYNAFLDRTNTSWAKALLACLLWCNKIIISNGTV